jgi:hypothetical protein
VDATERSDEVDARGRLEPYASVECGTEATHCWRRKCCDFAKEECGWSMSKYAEELRLLLACRKAWRACRGPWWALGWWGQQKNQLIRHLIPRQPATTRRIHRVFKTTNAAGTCNEQPNCHRLNRCAASSCSHFLSASFNEEPPPQHSPMISTQL